MTVQNDITLAGLNGENIFLPKKITVVSGTNYSGHWKFEASTGIQLSGTTNLDTYVCFENNLSSFGLAYQNKKGNRYFKYPTMVVMKLSPWQKYGVTSGNLTIITQLHKQQ